MVWTVQQQAPSCVLCVLLFRHSIKHFLNFAKGVTVYRALKQCNSRAGDWVAIPGAGGGLGHLGILLREFRTILVLII